ncbi:dephospho-CoA kinase [Roseovarius spongiae]|uniref:Dephospho-CoA kinase n=1 Tax=Roseovarius spongiae TaxID=2320272 RepID=A0A3A8ASL9_9RHOB|nr:dephospho-CoA kinase [Roseovarius spongiae]RKF13378.1 dephospho-CoA kinase [Roseovarius spongiae]
MTFRLGLTGSIGMGKSTTARLFAAEGCAVWDADAAVHRLYAAGGAAVEPMRAVFPDAIMDGAVSRDALKRMIGEDPSVLTLIERIVHPLVAADRMAFSAETETEITVFDIPLLFEKETETQLDAVVCVTVPAEVQRARVLGRGTMTEAQFDAIIAKQMPDAEKRARADYVIVTDTVEHARAQVQSVLRDIRENRLNA